jgi:GcrA cell cycle regulator
MQLLWKPEYVQVLQQGLIAGHSSEIIAVNINAQFNTAYSVKAVERKMDRLANAADLRWPQHVKDKLAELFNDPAFYSFREITDKLNDACNTSYTRSAILAQSKRMKLTRNKPAHVHKPKLRVVKANANSDAKRVILSVQATAIPALRCVEIEPRHLSMTELEPWDCRYPFGDDPATMTFCGHPKLKGSSYCLKHHELCWVKPEPPKAAYKKFFGTDFARGIA